MTKIAYVCAVAMGLLPAAALASSPTLLEKIFEEGQRYCEQTSARDRCTLDVIHIAIGAIPFDIASAALPLAASVGDRASAESFLETARRRGAAVQSQLEDLKRKYPVSR